MRSSHQKRHGFPSGARMTPRLFSCFTGSGSLSASDPSRIYFRGSAACRWNDPAHTEGGRIPSPSGSAAKPEGPILSPACARRVALPSRPTPEGAETWRRHRPSPLDARLVFVWGQLRGNRGCLLFRCAHRRSTERCPPDSARRVEAPRHFSSFPRPGPRPTLALAPAASLSHQNATKTPAASPPGGPCLRVD